MTRKMKRKQGGGRGRIEEGAIDEMRSEVVELEREGATVKVGRELMR